MSGFHNTTGLSVNLLLGTRLTATFPHTPVVFFSNWTAAWGNFMEMKKKKNPSLLEKIPIDFRLGHSKKKERKTQPEGIGSQLDSWSGYNTRAAMRGWRQLSRGLSPHCSSTFRAVCERSSMIITWWWGPQVPLIRRQQSRELRPRMNYKIFSIRMVKAFLDRVAVVSYTSAVKPS